MISPPLKWHGGKGAFHGKLAQWIIGLMPPHTHYVEPYFGGGSVLLAKDSEGVSEVANDLNFDLSNFWRVLRDQQHFAEFLRLCEATPFSEVEYRNALENATASSAIDLALSFFVRCRQSLAGRQKAFAPITRTRIRRGMNEQASAWLTAIDGLPAVHERLKRVVILNRDALDVIASQDGPATCFYCDPPYVHSSRATTGEYKYEMTDLQHNNLLITLGSISGKFLLSGYRCAVYDTYADLCGWKRHDFEIVNNAASGETKRTMTECVWTNY